MSKKDFAPENLFIKGFTSLCNKNGLDQGSVWENLMGAFACSISNIHEMCKERREERETEWELYMARLGEDKEKVQELFAIVLTALCQNPAQDFLGTIYMKLKLGKKSKAQVFTPFHVGQLMAKMMVGEMDTEKILEENGFISVSDPAIGGGCLVLAMADELRKKDIDIRNEVLFVGQDLDLTAVHMAYIQLSVTGCAAVIIHGDSLANPYTGNYLCIEKDNNLWYTPQKHNPKWFELLKAETMKKAG